MSDRAAELCDVLQLCLTFAASGSAEQQDAVAREGRAALEELRRLLAARQWPRVVRGGLPPGPHFLQLDDRALTALLADIQDAYGEMQDRLHSTEARLPRPPRRRPRRTARPSTTTRGNPVNDPHPDCNGGTATPGDRGAEEPELAIHFRLARPAHPTAPPASATTMEVTTEGAIYQFDARSMTVLRLRRTGAHLRRDGEQLTLLSWPAPVIGRGMELQLLVREDGVPTTRFTSAVLRIQR